MADFAIRAEGLAKQYRIGQMHSSIDTLRDHLMHGLRNLRAERRPRETIWALDGVSFEVQEGEALGIIGRNGAGKTTLLRLLSRITEPTKGHADIRGRVGSLLEVGTGFHAELTGRENIFLNGAILGMRRAEIVRKYDEIVEFAGVETFIDTPVKRYSSGMFVRLAFSVAAHLEPEILIVDEVLSVGDADFQKRCLGKMEGFGRSGRTVLFVSHSMPTVARLCPRLLLLDRGRIVADGPAESVIGQYLHGEHGTATRQEWHDPVTAPGDEYVRLRSARVVDASGATADVVDVSDEVGIEIGFDLLKSDLAVFPWIDIYSEGGQHVFSAMDTDPAWREQRDTGRYVSTAWIPDHLLNDGTLHVTVSVKSPLLGRKPWRHAEVESALTFQVVEQSEGETARGHFAGRIGGPVRPLLRWTTRSGSTADEPLVAQPSGE
ncbi:MAG: lipopolysaccharide transport system ATP-binding protein [Gaiellaceae bacterium]|nr:lipopolysaccharide transport system ATP-binding protein [Gaiellaceae bacterium]